MSQVSHRRNLFICVALHVALSERTPLPYTGPLVLPSNTIIHLEISLFPYTLFPIRALCNLNRFLRVTTLKESWPSSGQTLSSPLMRLEYENHPEPCAPSSPKILIRSMRLAHIPDHDLPPCLLCRMDLFWSLKWGCISTFLHLPLSILSTTTEYTLQWVHILMNTRITSYVYIFTHTWI